MVTTERSSHMSSLRIVYHVGRAAALAVCMLSVVYALVTLAGLAALTSPQNPIPDPYFLVMELLIVIMAPLLVVVMVTIHLTAAPERRAYSFAALAMMIVCAGITSSVHFVVLTVGRQSAVANAAWAPLLLSFHWPSVSYALDVLAWDWFYGLALLAAAPVFENGRLEAVVRNCLLASGALSLAGLTFLPFGNIQLRAIGIVGYAGFAPVVFVLVAIMFGRRASQTATTLRARLAHIAQDCETPVGPDVYAAREPL